MSRTIIEDRNCKIDVNELRPLGDMVIIKVLEKEKTVGGIHLAKAKATELTVGEVVKVGAGGVGRLGRVYPIELKAGDIVFTMGYIGVPMELRTGEYRFVRDNGIWAKVVPKDITCFDFTAIMPRLGNLVVRPKDDSTTLSGLIHYPAGQDKDSQMRLGEVIEHGPGIWEPETGHQRPTEVRRGHDVLFIRFAGAEVSYNGEKVRILNENDVKSITEGAL